MRKRVSGDVTVNAIAGTHVVFLGLDMEERKAKKLMGFAIQREDKTEREITWLRGNKTFPSVRPGAAFDDYISLKHPFQAFQWADYTAKPGYDYEYTVIPMFGKPGKLTEGQATTVAVTAERPEGNLHSVYFNRGAIASQAYAKKFGVVDPETQGPEALDWLARDLLKGITGFIERAKDAKFALHAAIYETAHAPVLEAFAAARRRGAQFHLVFGGEPGRDETERNRDALRDAGLLEGAIPRTNAQIAHNKFIVLSRNDRPVAVWTGSTNLSRNAIYGQLNVGHAIESPALAERFLAYWKQLAGDPKGAVLKAWVDANNPMPPADPSAPLTELFSPHSGREAFAWFKDLANATQQGLFMTFAFGIVKDFRSVFDRNDSVLRFALLEKYANGGSAQARAEATADIKRIRRLPNVGMALGSYIKVDTIDGWIREHDGIGTNVNWVHTKFMLVDPLGDEPVVLTGSANWSLPSVKDNDENMVAIRGNKRVADIYFGEFMRIFAHHRFRESVRIHLEQQGSLQSWKPSDLFENPDDWVPKQFAAGSEHAIKRAYFAG